MRIRLRTEGEMPGERGWIAVDDQVHALDRLHGGQLDPDRYQRGVQRSRRRVELSDTGAVFQRAAGEKSLLEGLPAACPFSGAVIVGDRGGESSQLARAHEGRRQYQLFYCSHSSSLNA